MFKFLGKKIREIFKGKVDEETLEDLEELFFQADLGSEITMELIDTIRTLYKKEKNLTTETILEKIKEKLLQDLESVPIQEGKNGTPHVVLIVGVNGNGKTTSIAKLAHYYQSQGKKVLLAAADTFRAAAIDQLELWADRTGAALVKGKPGGDPAAVVFDAIEAAKARGTDVVIIDTAGRLHTRSELMKELEKITRVSEKVCPGSPHETLLVLDATIGQNGVEQAKTFHEYTPLTGFILTKLDGTAKGGTALAIQRKLQLPIRYIGTGETIDSLAPFEPNAFLDSLLAS
ncbi:MAG: Signal recognition particle receptor FtsY [Chlamydiae bacterium]|nr:Signal recognition particle receptor FtsY [Chlamydiota bacterium]